jgi:signal peptidase I
MRAMPQRVASVLLGLALVLPGCGDKSDADLLLRAPSVAMAPTVRFGYHVSVDTDAYKHATPRRGDIVVFHPPVGAEEHECGVPSQPADGHPCALPTTATKRETKFIKRVTGLPGDRLAIRNNKTFINGRPLDEPYIQRTACTVLCNLPKAVTIRPGYYFTLGDNRDESDDSRVWGPVPRTALIGKVVAVCPPAGCGNE